MYIRRKTYSTYTDGGGEEHLFSTTEFVDEDQYLDEMMYSEPEERTFNSKAQKARRAMWDMGQGLKKMVSQGEIVPKSKEYIHKQNFIKEHCLDNIHDRRLGNKLRHLVIDGRNLSKEGIPNFNESISESIEAKKRNMKYRIKNELFKKYLNKIRSNK